MKRNSLISRPMSSLVLLVSLFAIAGRIPALAQDNKPRRPLPKPPSGSRGFEQGNRDASSRLIAAGATRGPLKPIAPSEGLAYDARPFFVWAPSPGASSYHFTLRDSAAAIIYETDVRSSQLSYPPDAPALVPGQLYSWRVSTAGILERRQGPIATFFVLAGEDAAQVRAALAKATLTTPKTTADRLAQARIFEDYGVWYDALRMVTELVLENPNDADARAYFSSLLQKLQDETQKESSQNSSPLPLWRKLGFDPSAVYSSLSRAFAKAGTPTVIASLWSVNASTKQTMQEFYKELAN